MYNTKILLLIENCYIAIENINHYIENGYVNKAITDSHISKVSKLKSDVESDLLLIPSDKARLINDLNKVIIFL